MAILDGVQIALAVLVCLGILLQTPNAAGMGGTFGGSSSGGGYRRRRGLESTLLRLTVVFTVLFGVISLAVVALQG